MNYEKNVFPKTSFSETQFQSVWSGEEVQRKYLKGPFLPTRLTAPGSPRMQRPESPKKTKRLL